MAAVTSCENTLQQGKCYTASSLSFALKYVERRTNAICEGRSRKPVVSWAPVTSEKRDCKGFIQHFYGAVSTPKIKLELDDLIVCPEVLTFC